jgi:RimJ/RimL family protein N-acetyltransferase
VTAPAHRLVETARLTLAAVTRDDLADLNALSSDPRVWQHLPSGRHTDLDTTARQVARFEESWVRCGLGYWTAHLRETGEFVGVGGCAARHEAVWNVYYRFRPEAQGNGYANELVQAARAAAAHVRPLWPVVAYLVEHNVASRRVAERAGLQLVWRGPDFENPDPDVQRLVFADRRLTAGQLELMTERR